MIGYAVLAFGVFLVLLITHLCLYCFIRRKDSPKEGDSAHQLAELYNHDH